LPASATFRSAPSRALITYVAPSMLAMVPRTRTVSCARAASPGAIIVRAPTAARYLYEFSKARVAVIGEPQAPKRGNIARDVRIGCALSQANIR
jgi:hypothetical protein